MAYIAKQDIIDAIGEEKLIQLTDDAGVGVVDDTKVNRAISYAVGTFDGYARTRYKLPVTATEKVKSTCVDLAVFKLYANRATMVDDGVYQIKKNDHDTAMKFLSDLAAGKAALDVPATDETETNPASPDQVLKASDKRKGVFSDDALKGY